MNGNIFSALADMTEEQAGLDVWHRVLDRVAPGSGGVYTAARNYPDAELNELVAALAEELDTPPADLVTAFGQYLFARLTRIYPQASEFPSLRELLMSIESVIHFEVRKLYEGVQLPTFEPVDRGGSLTLYYHSPRKMCALAVGLIAGAADHYGEGYRLTHTECMHSGAERCRLDIVLEG